MIAESIYSRISKLNPIRSMQILQRLMWWYLSTNLLVFAHPRTWVAAQAGRGAYYSEMSSMTPPINMVRHVIEEEQPLWQDIAIEYEWELDLTSACPLRRRGFNGSPGPILQASRIAPHYASFLIEYASPRRGRPRCWRKKLGKKHLTKFPLKFQGDSRCGSRSSGLVQFILIYITVAFLFNQYGIKYIQGVPWNCSSFRAVMLWSSLL